MGFDLKAYSELKSEFRENVLTLKGSHKAATEEELPQPRRHQVLLLQKTISLLDSSGKTTEEKSRILSGMMYLTAVVIEKSYSLRSAENSTFYRMLFNNVGVSEDNKLDSEDICNLLESSMKFLVENTCRQGKTRNGLLHEHPFSKIAELSLSDYWSKGSDAVAEQRKACWTRNDVRLAKEIHEEKERKRKEEERLHPKASLLSWITGANGSKKREDEDDEDQHIPSTSNLKS
ncbi:Dot/Icm T4SS effector [Legionella lansingensis]|uniref:Dot/Icm T4SS effector n=1 Tax=Legionella lansingensis TaxID=45067 RepID=A0A0W0VKE1_9GAMM|nr:hypothetical protein [Legionella lansingensis]KTD20570.1 Dot/Icm T4SS effector [Legionella lansingensis]SNV47815.1 Dot/Icm T4SS effector [Legionella lansingensis]